MPNAVIEDWDQFKTFLSGQPLCQWSARKSADIVSGKHIERTSTAAAAKDSKNDNADLIAALSSMA